MLRLNDRAFEILYTEIQKCAKEDSLSQREQNLLLKELEILRNQEGSPISLEELQQIVLAKYPQLSEKVLLAAAKINEPSRTVNNFKFVGIVVVAAITLLLGTTGTLVWTLLLSSKSPQLVMQDASVPSEPTTLSREEHYRAAMVLVEQANELINQETTPADLLLSEQKLNEAKKHIAQLPASQTVSIPEYSSNREKIQGRISGYVSHEQYPVTYERYEQLRSRVEELETQLSQKKQV